MRIPYILMTLFLISCASIALISCNRGKVFEQYQKFDNQSWHRFNILKFEVPIEETQNAYDIILIIRHLPEFNLKELPLNLTIFMPSGEMRTAEHTLKFAPKGEQGSSKCLGDLCDISFTLRENLFVSEPGNLKIEIENKWPRLELPGILEAGVILKKTKQ